MHFKHCCGMFQTLQQTNLPPTDLLATWNLVNTTGIIYAAADSRTTQ